MFHFPRLTPPALYIQAGVIGHDPYPVSRFGDPRVKASFRLTEAYRR